MPEKERYVEPQDGTDDGDLILFTVGGTLPKLALDALLPLIVAGIASVNDSFH